MAGAGQLRVSLKNYGTHADYAATVPLRGMVRFDGPSGAGKTTLLNAIAWALGFGPANPRGTLVRNGGAASTATTSVRLVCDAGWSVERRCRPAHWSATGTVGGASGCATGAEAVQAWLVRAFGPAVGSPELFPLAAYLRQGERAALGQQPTQMFRTLCDHACAPVRAGAVCHALQLQSKEADGAAAEAARGFRAAFPDHAAAPAAPALPPSDDDDDDGADADDALAARLAEAHQRLGAARAADDARRRADALALEAGLTAVPTTRPALASAALALRTRELCDELQPAARRGLASAALSPEGVLAALRAGSGALPAALEPAPRDPSVVASPTDVAAVERVGVEAAARAVAVRMAAPKRAVSTDALRALLELALQSASPEVVVAARARLASANATMPDWDRLAAGVQRAQAAAAAANAALQRALQPGAAVPDPTPHEDPPPPEALPGVLEQMEREDALQRCGAICAAFGVGTIADARLRAGTAAAAAATAANQARAAAVVANPAPPPWECGDCGMCGSPQALSACGGRLLPPHRGTGDPPFDGTWAEWSGKAAAFAAVPQPPAAVGDGAAASAVGDVAVLWSPHIAQPAKTGPVEGGLARVRLNTARDLLDRARSAHAAVAAAWRALLVQADRRAPPPDTTEAAAGDSELGDAVRALCARAGEDVALGVCGTAGLVEGIRVCRAKDLEAAVRWARSAWARLQEDEATFGPALGPTEAPRPGSRARLVRASAELAGALAAEGGEGGAPTAEEAAQRVRALELRVERRAARQRAERLRAALEHRDEAEAAQVAARVALHAALAAGRETADAVLAELSRAANDALAELFQNSVASVSMRSVPNQRDAGSALDIQVALGPCAGTLDHAGLSGGERARFDLALQLAVAEVVRPPVFFVDEGLSGLDAATALRALAVLRRMAAHMLVVVVSHQIDDPGGALFDRVLVVSPAECSFATCGQKQQPAAKRARKGSTA